MALTRLRLHVLGDTHYSRAFELAANEADDLTEPLTEIGHVLTDTVSKQFDSEGAHSGDRWQALTASYQAWRRRAYPEAQGILDRTGQLKTAATTFEAAVKVSRRQLVYEIAGHYPGGEDIGEVAGFHQAGAGKLPARKILSLRGSDRREIDRVMVRWLAFVRRRVIGRAT